MVSFRFLKLEKERRRLFPSTEIASSARCFSVVTLSLSSSGIPSEREMSAACSCFFSSNLYGCIRGDTIFDYES